MLDEVILKKYDMTIGIECHVQLATKTKLFSTADNDARQKSPNSVVSPIDYGLPGMLPVLSYAAVELAVKVAKALNADVAKLSRFDRKHYFYPDLPKGYQITQFYNPTVLAGYVDVPLEEGRNLKVRIHHAHLEEDAGKLTHYNDYSLVDLNRAGTPLVEIVSEPDIHSPLEAKAYATELYNLMTFAGVTHGDLYNGNMRFDVNISVAPYGSNTLGKRAEVKNLNSFRSVEKAAEYEFRRQVELMEKGEKIIQETRGWDEAKQKTTSQRSKENAQDYRYMPDADIPPIVLDSAEISRIQSLVPHLPPYYRQAWQVLGFDSTVTVALLSSKTSAACVQRILELGNEQAARRVGLWLLMTPPDDDHDIPDEIGISDENLIKLSAMVEENQLSSTAAKEVFFELKRSPDSSPEQIAEEKNLLQVSDLNLVSQIIDEVLADISSARAIEDIKNGNDKVIGFLVGQVMKKSAGKANPGLVQKIIREKLST